MDGLVLGADDYLTKPFAFPELAARVLALGRRCCPAVLPVLRRAGITLDPARREVFRDWLVRDLSAHLAAGAQEESDLIEESLAGAPLRT